MNAAGDDAGHFADLTIPEALLDRQKPPPKTLCVTHDCIDPALFDRVKDLFRIDRIGSKGLLDEQRHSQFGRRQDRLDVLVLGGGDDDRCHLGPSQKLRQIGRDKVRFGVFGQAPGRLLVDIA